MKKWLSLLFTGLLLCGVFSCGETTTTPNEEDKVNPIYYEWEHYDPRTHHTYVKNKDYGIVRELTAEEKNELILSVKDECPKSVSRYDYGSLYYGRHFVDSDTGETFSRDEFFGGCYNIYTNATEGYFKDCLSLDNVTSGIKCFFKDGHDYTYVSARYILDRTRVFQYRKSYVKDDEYYNTEPYITPFNSGSKGSHFQYLGNELTGYPGEAEMKAYKTSTGYLCKFTPVGDYAEFYTSQYNYYEIVYIFNESKQLTEYFNYLEPKDNHNFYIYNCDSCLIYQMFRYSDTGETPTKDLSFIKDKLKTSDYLYLERPSFTFGRVEEGVSVVNDMNDNDFIIGVESDSSLSDYIEGSLLDIRYEVEIPFVDTDKTKYNAILASFSFEIKGRLNGKYFSKWFIFKITEESYRIYGTTELTKDGTGVIYLPEENFQSNKKYIYKLSTALEIKDNDLILQNDMFLSGRIDIIEVDR